MYMYLRAYFGPVHSISKPVRGRVAQILINVVMIQLAHHLTRRWEAINNIDCANHVITTQDMR